jgi:hypothetical protein
MHQPKGICKQKSHKTVKKPYLTIFFNHNFHLDYLIKRAETLLDQHQEEILTKVKIQPCFRQRRGQRVPWPRPDRSIMSISHPKEFRRSPLLDIIAKPSGDTLIVDDGGNLSFPNEQIKVTRVISPASSFLARRPLIRRSGLRRPT